MIEQRIKNIVIFTLTFCLAVVSIIFAAISNTSCSDNIYQVGTEAQNFLVCTATIDTICFVLLWAIHFCCSPFNERDENYQLKYLWGQGILTLGSLISIIYGSVSVFTKFDYCKSPYGTAAIVVWFFTIVQFLISCVICIPFYRSKNSVPSA